MTINKEADAVNVGPHQNPVVSNQNNHTAQPANTQLLAGQESQSQALVALAADAELFHTPAGEAYASFAVAEHQETWPLESQAFRDWLSGRFYEAKLRVPTSQSTKDALSVLGGHARFGSESREVHVRIAEYDGSIYVDLADEQWRIVKVSAEGWQVIEGAKAPVRFRRTSGMLPLPEPKTGGDIQALRRFVNVTDDQWALIVSWLTACFRPNRPVPLLALHGQQGSAKSTTARILRSLVDPNRAPLRSQPKDERDLMIAATNGWVVVLDNLSKMSPSLSDSLCRLITGGGFGTRKLYQNNEEMLFDAMRPVVVTGIEELATRSDLLDRTLVLLLPAITENKRRTEQEFFNEFEREKAAIFGAVLDAVSLGLRNESSVNLDSLPRMADFVQWGVAVELAPGLQEGEFIQAYDNNREAANDLALEASPVATALISLVENCREWTGTASELLAELNHQASAEDKRQSCWPKSPQALGGILSRVAPNLREAGVIVEHLPRTDKRGTRLIRLRFEQGPTVEGVLSDNLTTSDNGPSGINGTSGIDDCWCSDILTITDNTLSSLDA